MKPLALFLCFALPLVAIPPERLYDWRSGVTVGVQGGIPANDSGLSVTNMVGLDTNGLTNVRDEIQNGLNTYNVVVLPAGRFLVSGAVTLYANRKIRGAGMNLTFITNTGGIKIAGYNNFGSRHPLGMPYSIPVTSSLHAGVTNFICTNTADFTVGRQVMLYHLNTTNDFDPNLVMHTGADVNPYRYLHRAFYNVVAKDAGSVTFWPPLHKSMSNSPMACWSYYTHTNIGLENFTLQMPSGDTTVNAIHLQGVKNVWLKGMRVRGAHNYNVYFDDASFCEVRECSIESAGQGGSNGSGILASLMCSSLIENNVFLDSFFNIELLGGSSGNVVGYNFLYNVNGQIELDFNHGPHNTHNLAEGNIVGRFISDGYFGSDSEGTLYRNWFHGTLPATTELGFMIALKRFTRNYSIVGNIIGRPSPFTMTYAGVAHDGVNPYGLPNMGNGSSTGLGPPWADRNGISGFQERDTNVFESAYIQGNYNYSNRVAETGAVGLASSLYRANFDGLRKGSLILPAIDPLGVTNTPPSFDMIPAGYFYVNGYWPDEAEGGEPLSTPTGLAAGSGIQRATFTWNTSTLATVFFLKSGTTSGSLTVWTNTPALIATQVNLAADVMHYVSVQASNASGASAWSAEVSFTPMGPNVIRGLRVTAGKVVQ